jgi:hypothetical protein
MSNYRDWDIKITQATRWKISCIVRARNRMDEGSDGLHVPATVDAFVEELLALWITINHPELDEIWKERQSADDKAAARLAQKYDTDTQKDFIKKYERVAE